MAVKTVRELVQAGDKVISVHQPWAWAIAVGHKLIENRTWDTKHRGRLWIHASKNRRAFRHLFGQVVEGFQMPDEDCLAFGGLVALTRLEDCVGVDKVAGRKFAEGPRCWILSGTICVPFFPCQGAQGLWLADRIPGLIDDDLIRSL